MLKKIQYLQALYSGSYTPLSPEYISIRKEILDLEKIPRFKQDRISLKRDLSNVLNDTQKANTYYGRKKKNKS